MEILSNEEKKEKENTLRNTLDEMTDNSNVHIDMSAQKNYIISKARYIIQLRNILAQIDDNVSTDIGILTKEECYKFLELIDRADTKLWKIENSLQDEYEHLLLSKQWEVDSKKH